MTSIFSKKEVLAATALTASLGLAYIGKQFLGKSLWLWKTNKYLESYKNKKIHVIINSDEWHKISSNFLW